MHGFFVARRERSLARESTTSCRHGCGASRAAFGCLALGGVIACSGALFALAQRQRLPASAVMSPMPSLAAAMRPASRKIAPRPARETRFARGFSNTGVQKLPFVDDRRLLRALRGLLWLLLGVRRTRAYIALGGIDAQTTAKTHSSTHAGAILNRRRSMRHQLVCMPEREKRRARARPYSVRQAQQQ